MTNIVPAEAFRPGEFLLDELEARGWTQDEFAKIIGRAPRLVSEIIGGKRSITPETAIRLSAALGTSAQFWMNLETAYQLYQLSRTEPAPERIGREARLREVFPIREIVKRGWIKESEDTRVLEARVLRFYGIASVDAPREFAHAAKRADSTRPLSLLQEAWLGRVKQIAEGAIVPRYSEKSLRESLARLRTLRSAPKEARHVPKILADCGVRFVVVESMASSRIDGVCFWLDGAPVIGMSLRIDRIDNFWFVLRHEIEHVLRGDGKAMAIVDSELRDATNGAPNIAPEELAANAAAAEFCVPAAAIDKLLSGVGRAIEEDRIVSLAQRLGVHPGLVVGQLQWRLQRFNILRKYLVKLREIVIVGAMTDGYGRQLVNPIH